MTNNVIAAELQSLAMCRKDGMDLYEVVCARHDGSSWTSNTFPYNYAKEFAATEKWNDRGREYSTVTVRKAA